MIMSEFKMYNLNPPNNYDHLKENVTCLEYNYAKTVNGDVNLLYDFIKINEYSK